MTSAPPVNGLPNTADTPNANTPDVNTPNADTATSDTALWGPQTDPDQGPVGGDLGALADKGLDQACATSFGVLTTTQTQGEENLEQGLRPESFQRFVGQARAVSNLHVFMASALQRQEALDHVLLHGPPGLGKTTLAHLIARHTGRSLRATAAPVLTKPGDLAALLTSLGPQDVLFIDEIHRLPIAVEELLYTAMEDYRLDIMIGDGPHSRAVRLPLPPFTLVGATTRSGLLSAPLRDRFGITMALAFYSDEELAQVIHQAALKLETQIAPKAAASLASRSRGTPRIALRLLRRVRDFAQVAGQREISLDLVDSALAHLGVNTHGLDILDQRYLTLLSGPFQGGPAGLDTLAAALSETPDTLEDLIEPYLLQRGLIQRTPRGRKLTPLGKNLAQSADPF
jgi:holliday junction DNA helicase RuvB